MTLFDMKCENPSTTLHINVNTRLHINVNTRLHIEFKKRIQSVLGLSRESSRDDINSVCDQQFEYEERFR